MSAPAQGRPGDGPGPVLTPITKGQSIVRLKTHPEQSVEDYISALPDERATAIREVRRTILGRLPPGYREEMSFGMITYVIPLERYPVTYNGKPLMYAALASQKNYMSVYLMNVYGDPAAEQWFLERYAASGKRLDMGKSCVRFRKLDDLPIDLIGETVARTTVEEYIGRYEASRSQRPGRRSQTQP